MLTLEELEKRTFELAGRPGHEKVRSILYVLLVDGLGAESPDIDFERPAPEVRGRIDALLGRTIFEVKSDLRRERRDAEQGLARYIFEREKQTGEGYIGIATDGADFIAYFLRNGGVVEVGGYHTDPVQPRDLLAWLQCTVAVGSGLDPDPHAITREFGRDSLAARKALDVLEELWGEAGKTAGAKLKRALWKRLLSLAYGTDIHDDPLFLQHTYLVIVAKAVTWIAMIEEPPRDAASLLHGTAFAASGIAGQSEPDFFDWILEVDGGPELVMQIAQRVARFRLKNIRIDILKALYESLIDPDTRHDLGEYYTPDWLAARVISNAVQAPLTERIMDPACGSGTFLFHAVRAVLEAAEADEIPAADAVRMALDNIAGIDIHPVAVIFARATFLLALLPSLRQQHPGRIAIPVYLGDALQWNLARVGEKGKQPDMFAGAGTLDIHVPEVTVNDPKPSKLREAMLRFPSGVASEVDVFDRVLNAMIEFGAKSESTTNFSAWMARELTASRDEQKVLRQTYEVMCRLQNEGRNHIWGYIARNLARPVWLSSDRQKADVVVGNPPWVSYRYMSPEFKKRFRSECAGAQLWVGGKVATQQDLSSYFYHRAALLYMKECGRIALVMPNATLTRQAYSKFRAGKVARYGYEEFRLRLDDAWVFGPQVWPLFPVPSCVLFGKRHDSSLAPPLPEVITAFAGTLPRRNASQEEAEDCLKAVSIEWPTVATDEGGSPYRRIFRNGATLFPRRLVFVAPVQPKGMLPANPEVPLVRGRIGNQDKKPWRDLQPPQGTIEKTFLRPVLLGESVAPFRELEPLQAIIPWDEERNRLVDAKEAAKRGYSLLSEWLQQTEEIWEEHKSSELKLIENYDYYGKLSNQFPVSRLRVVYSASGTRLAACIVKNSRRAVVEHGLYWAPVKTIGEARYLCCVLNSDTLRTRIEHMQAQGQWGARHFDKYVFGPPIPRFNKDVPLHVDVTRAVKVAEKVAASVSATGYFSQVRTKIRTALKEHGIAARLAPIIHE